MFKNVIRIYQKLRGVIVRRPNIGEVWRDKKGEAFIVISIKKEYFEEEVLYSPVNGTILYHMNMVSFIDQMSFLGRRRKNDV